MNVVSCPLVESKCSRKPAPAPSLKPSRMQSSTLAPFLGPVENFTRLPFKCLFPGDAITSSRVAKVYRRVLKAQQGNGPLIFVGCHEAYINCSTSTKPYGYPSYTAQPPNEHRSPHIIMSPLGLALNGNSLPCTRNSGGISHGWLMMHLMIRIYMRSLIRG